MAAKKAKVGRPAIPRKRLGEKERRRINRLLKVIRGFIILGTDSLKRETALNARLIAQLKAVDSGVVNKNIEAISFIERVYRPECTVSTTSPYSLFALECKKLHDHSAKRLFKEGLAQANIYLTRSKIVALVLYDFTSTRRYKKAFWRGNTISGRFAARVREQLGLYVIVRAAP
ncbi:MAG: hypothetical protein ACRENE_03685 [Polyangiaceae bacterium]